MKKISIVIPMYNEETVVHECYTRIKNIFNRLNNYDMEMIVVDDGSTDKTLELLESLSKEDMKLKILSFSRNFGHQSAIIAGLKETTGDAVIIIDADMQDPPELIVDMIDLWEKGNDVIYAVREKREEESIFKVFSAKIFYKILYSLSEVKIPKNTGDFRLADRKVIDIINSLPEHNKYLRGLFAWSGFKQEPIKYDRKKRFSGKTKYSFKKMMKLAYDGIISFSNKPLKIIGKIGILSVIVSFLILIYSIISYVFKLNDLVSGWTSIMVSITFFAGVQLVSLWILSEYISRIYDESKNRPEYIINKKINL